MAALFRVGRGMRVAITGAGAVRRSIARELLDRGYQVLLIERDPQNYRPRGIPTAELWTP